jgi:hypothetical protein
MDLAFAITVWKCQCGIFEYIIALLEYSPGSPALTFEKLYVMFTQVKNASHVRCLPLSPKYDKQTLFHLRPKIHSTKWRMDIDKHGYWRPWTSTSPALSLPKIRKASGEKQTSK